MKPHQFSFFLIIYVLQDANKPSTSGTSSKETCDKTTDNEEENTQEGGFKFYCRIFLTFLGVR